jgi:O-methyltransferase involved in polyketide biosynthesis
MKETYEKISPTAKMVAYLRTFTDIPFAAEIVAASGAEQAFRELAGQSADAMLRLVPIWEARYKATNQILVQRNIVQMLEIATGLSPRGPEMTAKPEVIYVATDLPEILAQVKTIAGAALASSNSHRPNLHFQTANALDRESLLKAVSIFETGRPIGIITEGLLPYFNRQEKTILARNIREILKKHDGIWITSDTSTKQTWGKVIQAERSTQQRIGHIAKSTQTSLEDNAFADENEVKQFFSEAGFAIEEYRQADTFEILSSIKCLNLNPTEIEMLQQVLKDMKTLILTSQTVKRRF